MVTRYSAAAGEAEDTTERFTAARSRFLVLVDLDSQAYTETVTARRAAKSEPGPDAEAAFTGAIRHAADVPLETARLAWSCTEELRAREGDVRPYMKSDWIVALALLNAAREGALANVVINLDDLRQRGAEIGDLEVAVQRLSGQEHGAG